MTAPIMHEPDECFDWCDGSGLWGPNPANEELYGDETPVWMCAGERVGSAMDV